MFIFWFNTFFMKSGYTPDKPDGGGEKNVIERHSDGSEIRTFSFGKEDLDKANKDKKHKEYPQNFKVGQLLKQEIESIMNYQFFVIFQLFFVIKFCIWNGLHNTFS